MVWAVIAISLGLTVYFLISWQFLVAISFVIINVFFSGMIKFLNLGGQNVPSWKLFVTIYASSSLVYLCALVIYSYLLKDKLAEPTIVYLLILALAVSLGLTYKISQITQ